MQSKSPASLALVALLAGATGIGFAPILVRWSEVGPSATAFYRLFFALPLLWLWMVLESHRTGPAPERTRFRRPAGRRDFGWLALAGLFFVGDLAVWHWSLQFTSVANSTLLTNFAPLFVTLGAWLLFGERLSAPFLVGLTVALLGAGLLVGQSAHFSPHHLLGDLLALITALFYAAYLLTVKELRRTFSTATIMTWSGLVSCTGFLLVALLSGEIIRPQTPLGWWPLLALALLSHVGGQTLIAYGFGHLPASVSSLNLLWQPVVAAALAWVLLREPIDGWQGLGGCAVLAGLALGNRTRSTPPAPSTTPILPAPGAAGRRK